MFYKKTQAWYRQFCSRLALGGVAFFSLAVLTGCYVLPTNMAVTSTANKGGTGRTSRTYGNSVNNYLHARQARPVNRRLEAKHNLLTRVAARFAMRPIANTNTVRGMARFFARKDLLGKTKKRAGLYLYHFVVLAEQRGLPGELALLPYIESAYNPRARSSAAAVGICQFIPSTGRRFGMQQSMLVDMRRDAVSCATAMYDYLEENYRRFGDWALALAAYNAGEGRVERAIKKNRRLGRPTHFSALPLPRETRNYVPALLGLAKLIAHPREFGYTLPVIPNKPIWTTVKLPADIDVAQVLAITGLSRAYFKKLNPALKRPVIPKAVHGHVVLPFGAAQRLKNKLARTRDVSALSSWTAVRVRRNSSAAALAKRYGMREATLRQANGFASKRLIRAGSTVVVKKNKRARGDISFAVASKSRLYTTPAFVRRRIRVHRGDTLNRLARRTGIKKSILRASHRSLSRRRLRRGVFLVRLPAHVAQRTRKSKLMAPEKRRVRRSKKRRKK